MLNGTTPGDSERAGSLPDLTHIGVPIAPATPDATPQATEVLDFDPDVIIFSAQGADCWNFVDALGRLGWTPQDIPLVLSGCVHRLHGDGGCRRSRRRHLHHRFGRRSAHHRSRTSKASDLEQGNHLPGPRALEYGMTEDDLFKGFATQGFSAIMNMWEAGAAHRRRRHRRRQSPRSIAATDGSMPTFGGPPLNCAGAPAPYIAVCSSEIAMDSVERRDQGRLDCHPVVLRSRPRGWHGTAADRGVSVALTNAR